MSFILDALKKSEIERQRQSVPGLMDAPPALRRGPLPRWALFLGALLAVNVVVLTVMLMRNNSPAGTSVRAKTAVPAATATAPVAPPAPAAPADKPPAAAESHFSPLDATPVYAPEIPVPAAGESAPGAAAEAPHSPARRGAAHVAHRTDPVLVEDSPSDEELLPTINELNLTGAQALPELHLDVHVFATNPADRFVYINMRKYREGNTLQEGPVLEKIRRDGVVLKFQGLRFLLPRQS
ncbi:MAG TPA: general secretion pathway protein GspB [Steroidobacteraceae bacterium]|jgi:general secretion pathway protein B|nr:general secretion pathway protein GspB [Steroidobacteraceae bacterium]